jgi:hypothetical protein
MNRSVKLDSQASACAIKIDAKTRNHLLTPKIQSSECSTLKNLPERTFTNSRLPAEFARQFELLRIDTLTASDE